MFMMNGKLTMLSQRPSAPAPRPTPSPEPISFRVLVLILASDNQPIYKEHQRLWRTYMNRNPNVDCYFYKGDPSLSTEAELIGDTLFIRIEDTLETVHEKTLRAFDFFEPRLSNYKCVFRTNLSSVVVFDRYLDYCRSIPEEDFCSAYIGVEGGVPFPAGAGYTITPNIIRRLIAERPPLRTQDDVSLGHALKEWGIPIASVQRVDLLNETDVAMTRGRVPKSVFHFRVKQNVRHYDNVETPYELELMQKLISEHYDDPATRRIEVVMRMCPDSRSALSGDGTRPTWFKKEEAFRSMFLTKGSNVYVTVLFDGDPTGHWIMGYPVTLVQIKAGDGNSSFLRVLDYIQLQKYPDNTIIYCLEDDYPHRPGWDTIVREGLSTLTPAHIKFDYITLYDHRDKYTYDMYKDLTARLAISPSVHWRTIPSTTNTWIALNKTFMEDFEIFWVYQNQDHEKFLTLGRRGRMIGSCIPGYSTHAHIEHLSPQWESSFVREL